MIPEPSGLSARSQQQWEAYVATQVQVGANGHTLFDKLVAAGYSAAEARAILSRALRARQGKLGGALGCSVVMFLAGLVTLITPVQSQNRQWFWIGAIICGLIGIAYSGVQLGKTR